MGISIVGSVQTNVVADGGNVTIDLSGLGLQQNDVIIVSPASYRFTGDAPAMVTSGYTSIHAHTGTTSGRPTIGAFYKVMGATPDSSVVVSADTSSLTGPSAIAIALRGVDPSTVLDQTTTTAGETFDGSPDPASITTQTDGAWVIALGCTSGTTDGSPTYPSGYTNTAVVNSSDTAVHAHYVAIKEITSAGAENPGAFGVSVGNWFCITIAVKPKEATIDQEGFAFGDDDDSESAHTLDTQDTNVTEPLGTKTLRTILNATGDPASSAFSLRYQKNGSGGYVDVPVGSSGGGDDLVIDGGDTTNDSNNSTSTNIDVTLPAFSSGDLVIIAYDLWNNTGTPTVSWASGPDGETVTDIINGYGPSGSGGLQLCIGYFIATAGYAGGSMANDSTVSTRWAAAVTIVPEGEFDATTPIGAKGGGANSATDVADITFAGFSAGSTDGGGKLLVVSGSDQDPFNTTMPTGYTLLETVDGGRAVILLAGRDTAVTNSETIGTAVFDLSGSSADAMAVYGFIVRTNPPTDNEIYVSTSSNVASGGEATTARLTAPSGKDDYPTIGTATETAFASTVTSMPVDLPAGISDGDKLIAIVETRYATTWTPPTDWTEVDSQVGGSSVGELTVFEKDADGTEGSSATWTAGTGNTAIWQVYKIDAGTWHGTSGIEISKTSGDYTTNPDPPSLTPSWGTEKTLWIEVAGNAASSNLTTGASTNYSNYDAGTASSGGAQTNIATATRESSSSSENPGEFANVGNIRYWSAMTIAIRTRNYFDTGRRWDDENGSDSIDITYNGYTETEWILTTQDPATTDDYFEFRVYADGLALDSYTVTPKWTISAGGGTEEAEVSPITETISIPSVTATYIEIDEAGVSPLTIVLNLTSSTASYVSIQSAESTPLTISINQTAVTATYSSLWIASLPILTTVFSIVATTATYIAITSASVSPIPIITSIPNISGSYIQVETASTNPLEMTLSVPNVVGDFSNPYTADVSPLGKTLTLTGVTADYTQIETADISPLTLDTTLTSVTSSYIQVETADLATLGTILSIPDITASSEEVRTASVDSKVLNLSLNSLTANYTAELIASVSPIEILFNINELSPTFNASANSTFVSLIFSPTSVTATYIQVELAEIDPINITLSLNNVIADYTETYSAELVSVEISLSSNTVTASHQSVAETSPLILSLSPNNITASFDSGGVASVSAFELNITNTPITAQYDSELQALVTPFEINISIIAVTANYTQANIASVSPVEAQISLNGISAEFTQQAVVSSVSLSISVGSVTAISASQKVADVSSSGLILTVTSVTPIYIYTANANVSPIGLLININDLTGNYAQFSRKINASISTNSLSGNISTPSLNASVSISEITGDSNSDSINASVNTSGINSSITN